MIADQLTHEYETYLYQADRMGATRLSSGDAGAVSPDGRWALAVAADSTRAILTPVGAGEPRSLPNESGLSYESYPSWLPDNRRFAFIGRLPGKGPQGFVQDIEGKTQRAFTPEGVTWASRASGSFPVSPDARYAALLDPSGRAMRWPIEGGQPAEIPGLRSDETPLTWTEDGRALFVLEPGFPFAVSRVDLASGKRAPWETIHPSDVAGSRLAILVLSANGKYWALSMSKLMTDLYVIDGLR